MSYLPLSVLSIALMVCITPGPTILFVLSQSTQEININHKGETVHTIETYKDAFTFHKEEHEELTTALLNRVSAKTDIKLKVQKASIQLIGKVPFSVLGFRRSKSSIFVEFYTKEIFSHSRIIQTITAKNGLPLHRIELQNVSDINDELIEWIITSEFISRGQNN